MFGIGTTELIIILVIVLIIFGVGKLPDIGAGMGKAIRNFKKATSEDDDTAVVASKGKGAKLSADTRKKGKKPA